MNKLVRHWAECAALTTEQRYCLSVQQLNQIADELERITELEARTLTVKLPDVEKWRSADAVRAQNAYKVLAGKSISAACATAGIKLQIEGE